MTRINNSPLIEVGALEVGNFFQKKELNMNTYRGKMGYQNPCRAARVRGSECKCLYGEKDDTTCRKCLEDTFNWMWEENKVYTIKELYL